MNYLLILIIAVAGMALIFFMVKVFFKEPYHKSNPVIFLDSKKLENIGFTFSGNKYVGVYKNFHTSISVTTNIQPNDQVTVMVAVDTGSGPIDFLKTFKTGYFKNKDKGGCTYIGFLLLINASADPVNDIQHKLDNLILLLNEKSIRPFSIG